MQEDDTANQQIDEPGDLAIATIEVASDEHVVTCKRRMGWNP
jgi:hypothetical protein